jgi:5-methylcytosine-specific restriction endonuclease McrA
MADNKVNAVYPFQTCTKCGETKPTTRENFGTQRNGKPRSWCRFCLREYNNTYAAEDRERGRERARIRKAQLESVGVVNEHLQYRRPLLRDQQGQCYFCKVPIAFGAMEIDHLTPISRGGSSDYDNLAGCCSQCNKAKANRTEEEFIVWRRERLKFYV